MVYVKQSWEDSPSTTTPITAKRLNHLETQYEESKELITSSLAPVLEDIQYLRNRPSGPSGTITLKKHTSGAFYEVLTFDPSGVGKWQIPVSGPGGMLVSNVRGVRDVANSEGFSAVVGGNAATPESGGFFKICGLDITNGVPIQDFGVTTSGGLPGADLEALVLTREGVLTPVRKSDGKSASWYVSELGAVESFGYGPILVDAEVDTRWWSDSRFRGFYEEDSARTMMGQRRDGKIVLILVYGRSGVSGIRGKVMSDICLLEGCEVAVNLDGGGTVQGSWAGEMFHASSDPSQERKIASGVTLSGRVNRYVSGNFPLTPAAGITRADPEMPQVQVSRAGEVVTLKVSASFTAAQSRWVKLSNDGLPDPFTPTSNGLAKGVVSSSSGAFASISVADDGTVNVRNNQEPIGLSTGELRFTARGSK